MPSTTDYFEPTTSDNPLPPDMATPDNPPDKAPSITDYIQPARSPLQAKVYSRADELGLPRDLVGGIVDTESKWTHKTRNGQVLRSPKNAYGVMQVVGENGGHLRTVGGKQYDLLDEDQNIEAGLNYLKEGYDYGNHDPKIASLYYFGGKGNAAKLKSSGRVPNISDGGATASQYINATTKDVKNPSPQPSITQFFKPSSIDEIETPDDNGFPEHPFVAPTEPNPTARRREIRTPKPVGRVEAGTVYDASGNVIALNAGTGHTPLRTEGVSPSAVSAAQEPIQQPAPQVTSQPTQSPVRQPRTVVRQLRPKVTSRVVEDFDNEPLQATPKQIEFAPETPDDRGILGNMVTGARAVAGAPNSINAPSMQAGKSLTIHIQSDKPPTQEQLSDALLEQMGAREIGQKYRQETGRSLLNPALSQQDLEAGYDPKNKTYSAIVQPSKEDYDVVNAYSRGGLPEAQKVLAGNVGEQQRAIQELEQHKQLAYKILKERFGLNPEDVSEGNGSVAKGLADTALGLTHLLNNISAPVRSSAEVQNVTRQANEAESQIPEEKTSGGRIVRGITGLATSLPEYGLLGGTPAGAAVIEYLKNRHRGNWEAIKSALEMYGAGKVLHGVAGRTGAMNPVARQLISRGAAAGTGIGLSYAGGERDLRKLFESGAVMAGMPIGRGKGREPVVEPAVEMPSEPSTPAMSDAEMNAQADKLNQNLNASKPLASIGEQMRAKGQEPLRSPSEWQLQTAKRLKAKYAGASVMILPDGVEASLVSPTEGRLRRLEFVPNPGGTEEGFQPPSSTPPQSTPEQVSGEEVPHYSNNQNRRQRNTKNGNKGQFVEGFKEETPAPVQTPESIGLAQAGDAGVRAENISGQPAITARTEDSKTSPRMAGEPQVASVPFMITRSMRADLKGRGYTDAEIDKWTPQQANDVLSAAVPAEQGAKQPKTVALSDAEVASRVRRAIGKNKISLTDIIQSTGLSNADATRGVLMLELANEGRQHPQAYFSLTEKGLNNPDLQSQGETTPQTEPPPEISDLISKTKTEIGRRSSLAIKPSTEVAPEASQPNVEQKMSKSDIERQSKIDKAAARKPRKPQSADRFKHSASQYVALSGGIEPSQVLDTSPLKGLRHQVYPLLRKGGRSVEDVMHDLAEANYYPGRLEQYKPEATYDRTGLTENDFIDLLAQDAREKNPLKKHYSGDNEIQQGIATELEDVGAREVEPVFSKAERLANFLEYPEVRGLFKKAESGTELSPEDLDNLRQIAQYQYELEGKDYEPLIHESRERGANNQARASAPTSREAPSVESSRNIVNPQGSESIYAPEEDDSFNFGENVDGRTDDTQKPVQRANAGREEGRRPSDEAANERGRVSGGQRDVRENLDTPRNDTVDARANALRDVQPTEQPSDLISQIKSMYDEDGHFARGTSALEPLYKNKSDAELVDALRWTRSQDAWTERFIGTDIATELRKRGVSVDEIKWQIQNLPQSKSKYKLSDYYQPEQAGLGFREAESGLFAEGGAKPVERYEPAPDATKEQREYIERDYRDRLMRSRVGDDNTTALYGLAEDDSPVRQIVAPLVNALRQVEGTKNARQIDVPQIPDVIVALKKLSELRRADETVSDYLKQDSLFTKERELTPKQESILAEMGRTGKLPSGLIREVKQPEEAELFGAPRLSRLSDTERANYEQAKQNVKSKLSSSRLKSSDPYGLGVFADLAPDLIKIGKYHALNGYREFKAWSEKMVNDLGEGIRPVLDKLWAHVQDEPKTEPERVEAFGERHVQQSNSFIDNPETSRIIGDIEDGKSSIRAESRLKQIAKDSGLTEDYANEVINQAKNQQESLSASTRQGESARDSAREPTIESPEPASTVESTIREPPKVGGVSVGDTRRLRSLPASLEQSGLEGGADRFYDVKSNVESENTARQIIKEKGVDASIDWVKQGKEPSAEQSAVALELIKGLSSDPATLSKAVDVASTLAEKSTREGQAIQYYATLSKESPEGALLAAQRIVAKRSPDAQLSTEAAQDVTEIAKRLQESEAKVSTLEKQIEELNKQRASGARGIRPKLATFQEKMDAVAEEARARLKERQAKREQEKAEGVEYRHSGLPVIDSADLKDIAIIGAAKIAKGGVRFAQWSADMINEFGEEIKPHLKNLFSDSYKMVDDERKTENQSRATRAAQRAGASTPDEVESLIAQKRAEAARSRQARADLQRTFTRLQKGELRDFTERALGTLNRNALLTPRGMEKILVGMTGKQAADMVARVIESPIDSIISKTRGTPRTAGGLTVKGLTRASIDGARDGARNAYRALRGRQTQFMEAEQPLTGIKPLDASLNSMQRLYSAKENGLRSYAYNESIQRQSRVLALNDLKEGIIKRGELDTRTQEYIKNPPVLGALNSLVASEKASVQADYDAAMKHITKGMKAEQVIKYKKNLSDLMNSIALRESDEQVYAEPSKISEKVNRAASSLGDVGQVAKNLYLPFMRRPSNSIVDFFQTYVGAPLNIPVRAIQMLSKPFSAESQSNFARAASRGLVGYGIMGLGYYLSSTGNMHNGNLVVGDKEYPIWKVPFIGWLLGIGSTLHDQGIGGAAKQAGKQIIDHPLLRGLEGAGQDVESVAGAAKGDFKGLGKRAVMRGGDWASRLVPQPLPIIAEASDNQQRITNQGVMQRTESRVPFLRKSLPAYAEKSYLSIFDPLYQATPQPRGSTLSVGSPAQREATNLGVDVGDTKQNRGESSDAFNKRKSEVDSLVNDSVSRLLDSQRYGQLSSDEKKEVLKEVVRRVRENDSTMRSKGEPLMNRGKLNREAPIDIIGKAFDALAEKRAKVPQIVPYTNFRNTKPVISRPTQGGIY